MNHLAANITKAIGKSLQEDNLDRIAELAFSITHTDDPVVITGVGKSGRVAALAADQIQTSGVPATYISVSDLLHGSLTMLKASHGSPQLIVLTNSGETQEVVDVLDALELGLVSEVKVTAITSTAASTVGRSADLCIAYGPVREGSSDIVSGTLPTTSVIAQLAIMSAVALEIFENTSVAVLKDGHPAGTLYEGKAAHGV